MGVCDSNQPSQKVQNRGIAQALSRGEAPHVKPSETFGFARPHFFEEPRFSDAGVSVHENKCAPPYPGRGNGFFHYFKFPPPTHERRHKPFEAMRSVTPYLSFE